MLDDFDFKILRIVQADNRMPTDKIAERVGLSASAVQRRLAKLRAESVIERDVAVIAPEAVGQAVTAIVTLTLEHESPATLNAIRTAMLRSPQVMQCYCVTGQADFIVILTAKNLAEYADLGRELFANNPNVKRYESSLVIEHVKRTLAVPIGDA